MQTERHRGRKLSGTFISDWLVRNWDDDKWARELSAMREIDMEYLILAPNVLYKNDGTWVANYPTEIDGARQSYDGNDMLETMLRNAKKFGMKVFLGLNMNEKWWENWWDTQTTQVNKEWLYEQMQVGNVVADELYDRYHSRYPETFYGWYWVWEFWNSTAMTLAAFGRNQNIDILVNCLNINLDHLTKLDPSMPLLLSPFANMNITTYDDLYYMWKDIVLAAHFREGDILCPQDSVGAGGTKMTELRSCYASYKAACGHKPGLRFWANNESFDHTDWSSASLDRFVNQLEITAEFAEINITFAYNNYYSPINTDRGFHEAFKHYLRTGKLSSEPPASPAAVRVTEYQDGVIVEWDSCCNAAGYYIFKNGKIAGSVKCQRDDGRGYIPDIPRQFIDKKGNVQDRYGVAAFSFEGNFSLIRCADPLTDIYEIVKDEALAEK